MELRIQAAKEYPFEDTVKHKAAACVILSEHTFEIVAVRIFAFGHVLWVWTVDPVLVLPGFTRLRRLGLPLTKLRVVANCVQLAPGPIPTKQTKLAFRSEF